MTFAGPRSWREWTAVMAGDVVRDGAGGVWRVDRTVIEPGGRPGDGALVAWAQLCRGVGGANVRTLRVPDTTVRVEMSEGPGYGVRAAGDDALAWAVQLAIDRLGGTVLDALGE